MEKKNVIFLSVIAVATLLTAVIGTTFAYFTANVSGSASSVSVQTATVSGTELEGAALVATDVYPGYADAVAAKITSQGTNTVDTYYKVTVSTTSTLVDTDLKVSLYYRGKDQTALTQTAITDTSTITGYTGTSKAFENGLCTNYLTATGATEVHYSFVNSCSTSAYGSLVGTVQTAPKATVAAKVSEYYVKMPAAASGARHDFVLYVDYAEANASQDNDQGKGFASTVTIAPSNVNEYTAGTMKLTLSE